MCLPGHRHSDETRVRISEVSRVRWADPAYRAKVSTARKAFARSDAPAAVAHRERLRAANEARRLPLETREQRLLYAKLRRFGGLSREAALAEVLREVVA